MKWKVILNSVIFSVFCLLFAMSATANDRDLPKVRRVELKPFTLLVADILPGRGVKLVFPWVLDENSTELPFSEQLTNSDIFEVHTEPGQNHIVYKIKENNYNIEGELSDAFINVAGFQINLTLRVTFSKSKHSSNIEFFLNKEDRLELIERAINRRKAALVKEYEKKVAELDKRAETLSLKLVGRLATGPVHKYRIKTEEKTTLENGDKIMFFCDKIYNYGPFYVIPIEVGNESDLFPLYIQNISLEKVSKGSSVPLLSEFEVSENKVEKNEVTEGFIITRCDSLLSDGDTKAVVFTDRGKCEVIW